jgi:2-polyprenyl-6-methoxyphenol hydroxylase-like FAD-dependent oxidoreductase
MRASGTKVLVIGGGIGGLTTAIALRQAGIDTEVFERASDLRRIRVGGGIHLWTSAMRALERVGLAAQLQAVGSPIEWTEFLSWRGRVLAHWPVGKLARKLGVRDIGLSRADFYRGLSAGLDNGTLRLGAECTGFVQDAAGVTARFTDGSEARGSLLIGADGLHSAIRSQLVGKVKPRYAGYAQWQAIINFDHEMIPPGVERIIWGPATRFLYHHVAPGRVFWACAVYGPEGRDHTVPGRKAMLSQRFRGWPRPIEALIANTDEAGVIGADIYDRPPLNRWGTGRVTLLGDAAHPLTTNLGQGATMAVEDAVVLHKHLRTQDDAGDALRAYEAERIPATTTLVNRSWRLALIGQWKRPGACAGRDVMLKLVIDVVGLKQHAKEMALEF